MLHSKNARGKAKSTRIQNDKIPAPPPPPGGAPAFSLSFSATVTSHCIKTKGAHNGGNKTKNKQKTSKGAMLRCYGRLRVSHRTHRLRP